MESKVEKTNSLLYAPNIISHIRKNHALEHASINVLSTKRPNTALSGYSIDRGFWILGSVDIEDVKNSVDIAVSRMKNGESGLAIHKNCGTNLAVSALCLAGSSLLVMAGADTKQKRLDRFSWLMLADCVMLEVSRPLGLKAQKYVTTDADISKLQIVGISSQKLHGIPLFFVETQLLS